MERPVFRSETWASLFLVWRVWSGRVVERYNVKVAVFHVCKVVLLYMYRGLSLILVPLPLLPLLLLPMALNSPDSLYMPEITISKGCGYGINDSPQK